MSPQDPNLGFDPEELEVLGDESAENGDSLDFNIDTLAEIERFVNLKTVAYKTVDTFAGITKKRLWLRNAAQPGTDGNEIRAPFTDPAFYRLVEEQLAHVLFRTDARAKRMFVEEYAAKVEQIAKQRGVVVQKAQLAPALAAIITLLERRRVQSLWGLLYSGSHAIMRGRDRMLVKPLLPEAHESVLNLMACLEADPDKVEAGQLDRFRPYIEESFRKVFKRGPVASLAVAKWLVMQLVNEIIREAKNIPPPPSPQPTDEDEAANLPSGNAGGHDEDEDEDQQSDSDEDEGDSAQGPGNIDEDQEDTEGEGQSGDSGGEDKKESKNEEGKGNKGASSDREGEGRQEDEQEAGRWNPPAPDASAEERAKALADMLQRLGAPPREVRDPVEESKFQKGRANAKSAATSSAGLNAPVNKPDQFEQQLEHSEAEMDDLVQQARAAMRQQFREDDWLQKDAMAKIVFIDEPPQPQESLSYEDAQTVQRLRALFHRVMGRRKAILADSGIEVDVPAYIERRMTGAPMPVFREEMKGRGFRAHVLLDLSGSMEGLKIRQCERAARIIQRALKYPFVTFDIWGFTSHEAGEVKLTRFDPKAEIKLSMKLQGAGGYTPIHIAARVAIRKLTEGHEDKQLFLLTDGFPVHQRRDGRQFGTRQLLLFLRNEIRTARKDGVNVTGVILGERKPTYDGSLTEDVVYELSDRDLFFVFGSRRNWKKMTPDRIGNDLVQLVATSFVEFLQRR